MISEQEYVLSIEDLHSSFFTDSGEVKAVNGVTIKIPKGKIVGLVGESGCGKSMTAKSVMGLLRYPGRVVSGSVMLGEQQIAGLKERELRKVCGKDVSMIFQEPMTSLNPVLKVGRQVAEVLRIHDKSITKEEAKKQVVDMFVRVGIPEAERRYNCYPHELSGGLRQRVMIAMAMICKPKLLIADEPTTALDVTIEAQILRLMKSLCEETGMSVLIITHNLGVVAQICDYVYVMYAGKIMEQAETFEMFDHPMHPYTQGLMASIPRIGKSGDQLHTIPGQVPNLLHMPAGCSFCTRCDKADAACREKMPELREMGEAHSVRCLKAEAQESVFENDEVEGGETA